MKAAEKRGPEAEYCPHCDARLERDPYSGTCNSCGKDWPQEKSAAESLLDLFRLDAAETLLKLAAGPMPPLDPRKAALQAGMKAFTAQNRAAAVAPKPLSIPRPVSPPVSAARPTPPPLPAPRPTPPPLPKPDPWAQVVEQNVPEAVRAQYPVVTGVRKGTADYAGQVYGGGQLPANFQRHAVGFDGGTRRGHFVPGAAPHIAIRDMPATAAAPVLRHEGYHGMVNLLQGGTPRAAVPGARWHHAAVARMMDSSYSPVRALGLHANEVGARVLGEGGFRGAWRGLTHALSPSDGYSKQLRRISPTVARGVAAAPAALTTAAVAPAGIVAAHYGEKALTGPGGGG